MKSIPPKNKIVDTGEEYIRILNQIPLVVSKEWDYLIVLDGCRYDTFEEINDIPGKLSPVWSPAARTPQWMSTMFDTKLQSWDDVVFISGSQFSSNYKKLFKYHHQGMLLDWDDEEETISGKNITQSALGKLVEFPNNKMIIWYTQPHVPFIGEKRIVYSDIDIGIKTLLTIKEMVQHPKFTLEYVYEAYEDNLRYVLSYVKKFLSFVKGRVVITSDHGNGFGENNYYGHENARVVTKFLREVPWLEVDLDKFNKLGEKKNE